jgi:hypothetical protein
MARKSLADKLASLANPEPVFHDPEVEDDVTAAKVVSNGSNFGRLFTLVASFNASAGKPEMGGWYHFAIFSSVLSSCLDESDLFKRLCHEINNCFTILCFLIDKENQIRFSLLF